jgi:hypothetical protein
MKWAGEPGVWKLSRIEVILDVLRKVSILPPSSPLKIKG